VPQLEVVSAFNVESTKGGDAGQGWPAVAEGGGKPLRRHSAKLWVTAVPMSKEPHSCRSTIEPTTGGLGVPR
jgi:hypothetical protein